MNGRTIAIALSLLVGVVLLPIAGCGGGDGGDKKTRIAFVTNNASPFWNIAEAGVRAAEKEFGDVEVQFEKPGEGTLEAQQRLIENLVASGVKGIAVSANTPENQIDFLNDVASKIPLITHDSDAPGSERLCYVGTNNVEAGRQAATLIKEALPNGGKVMIFVGYADAQNAKERIGGIREGLRGTNIEIVDVRTDQTDTSRAKQNVEDTLTSMPDVNCLVGIWSYNGPQIISAVKDINAQDRVEIVAFDEEDDTLRGVQDGIVHGAVVQQPYKFGYESVKILRALAQGKSPKEAGIPESGVIDVPVRLIKQDNVDAFWAELKEMQKK